MNSVHHKQLEMLRSGAKWKFIDGWDLIFARNKSREKMIEDIRQICKDIGCSGVGKECKTAPYLCKIISKVVMPKGWVS